MKRLLSLTLTLLIATVSFAHEFEVSGIYYNVSLSADRTVYVTYKGLKYSSYANEYTGEVTIPSTVTYDGVTYSVTGIGVSAFEDCTELTSVVIPGSVTEIGRNAFSDCYGLTSATIGNGVKTIGRAAFYNCTGLTGITFPNSVTEIGESAFGSCTSLTDIVIPNSVTTIGIWTFSGCSGLTSITIGKGVTSVDRSSFQNCNNVESITIDAANTLYDSRENCNAIIETSTNKLIHGCKNTVIPNSVECIDAYAFNECAGLKSIVLGEHLTSIEEMAFYGCSGLTSIKVDARNPIYDSREDCNAIIVTAKNELIYGSNNTVIPDGVKKICFAAFNGCADLKTVVVPGSVTEIDQYAFRDCTGLTKVVIPSSVTDVRRFAFLNCTSLTGVYSVTNTPAEMGEGVFTCENNGYNPNTIYSNATLYVPLGTKATYQAKEGWKQFSNIVEKDFEQEDPTGIETIESPVVIDGQGVYTFTGVKVADTVSGLNTLPQGIYVVNGKKVAVK